jgi:hypothetical protein
MKDLCELIELTDCELDAVAGGNPFSINGVVLTAAGIASSVSASISTSFANAPLLSQTNTSDQHVSISGP